MKTPIKHTKSETKALAQILKKIPEGSIIDSFLFFSGQFEFSLADYNRFVCAHTTKYVIHEFWHCMFEDSESIYNIINSDSFKFDQRVFETLQENWAKYEEQYIRSALFFLLNRCSETGDISSGAMNVENFNKSALADLKTFKPAKNFHLSYDKCDLIESMRFKSHGDYIIINAGNFTYNLFDDGKTVALEETVINHMDLKEFLHHTKKKFILVYKHHNKIPQHYEGFNIEFINKFGKPVENSDSCKEIIIANF